MRKQTRFSISVGNVKHVHVGNFEDLSLNTITLLYKCGDWQDYEHVARQLGLNGGKVELRGDQCRNVLHDINCAPMSKADLAVLGSMVHAQEVGFCLYVYEEHEERAILNDARDELGVQEIADMRAYEDARRAYYKAEDKLATTRRLGVQIAEKLKQING